MNRRHARWTREDDEHLAAQARAEATADVIARITAMPRSAFTVHVPRPVHLHWWQPGSTLLWAAVLLILGIWDTATPGSEWIGALLLFDAGYFTARWIWRRDEAKHGDR